MSISISREELFQLVWQEPMVKVAKRFAVSDVAVAKACRRHKIPLPGLGYWARIAAGQKIARPSLPAIKEQWMDTLTFEGVQTSTAMQVRKAGISQLQEERNAEKRIPIPEEPESLDPLVRNTLVVLTRGKPNTSGILLPQSSTLDIRVSPSQLHRAITITDALVKALLARGHRVHLSKEDPVRYDGYYWSSRWKPETRTRVVIDEEELGFQLIENVNRVPHTPTAAEKLKIDRGAPWGIPEFDEIPNGELILSASVPPRLGLRSNWADGKRQRVEHCLKSFVEELLTAAHAIKKAREDDNRAARQRQEDAIRQAEWQKRQREEADRIRRLNEQMANWQRAEEVRTYAKAVEEMAIRKYGSIEKGGDLSAWISWMRSYANRTDPLTVSDA